MPELPEVETIRRSLSQHILGSTLERVEIVWPGAVRGWNGLDFSRIAAGKKIESIGRKGKYLLIYLEEGWVIVAHMRMTGRLLYYHEETALAPHTHVVLKMDHGELHFNDQRKFGRLEAVPAAELESYPALAKLGPEPIGPDFSLPSLCERLAGKRVNVKAALLDQTIMAGLGNIYADETLFQARIAPERLVCDLSQGEIERMAAAARNVLEESIAVRGTTFRDYRDADGAAGEFQGFLKVYSRAGEPCVVCGRPLEKVRLAGRTTVWCPYCQGA